MPVKLPVLLQTGDMPGFSPVDLPFMEGSTPPPTPVEGVVFDPAATSTLASAAGTSAMTVTGPEFESAGGDIATTGPITGGKGTLDRVIELVVTASSGAEELSLNMGDLFGGNARVNVPANARAYLLVLDADDSLQLFDSLTNAITTFAGIGSVTTDDLYLFNGGGGAVAGHLVTDLFGFTHDWSPMLAGNTVYDWTLEESRTF